MTGDPVNRLNAALAGRYRIERQLGEGGMATVYLADDLRHERKVALKVLKPELAAVIGAERFLAEIKTTANLQHPHILPLFDSGEAGEFLFYVMPYVDGESLRDRLDREHQLPVDEAVQIAKNVAEALDYAHRHGVIHRDIKPANILLQDGKSVVSDFGIALAVTAGSAGRLTETGLSVGTPHYMSPEQATGDQTVGPPADVYALGCVLYEMLVGEPPYTGSTPQAVLGKIVTGEADSVTKHRRSVPPNVDAAIRRALEKVPADRFASADAFATALSESGFRHGQPTPDRAPASAGLWKLLSVAATGLALLLAGTLAWTLLRPEAPRPLSRSLLIPPAGVDVAGGPNGIQGFAVSPDGQTVVFADGPTGQLYRQSLDQVDALPIPGGEHAWYPFFSPDGAWVGYFDQADSTLRKIGLDGSGAQTLAPVPPSNRSAGWGEDGYIVGYSTGLGTLWRVRDSGGDLEPIPIDYDGAPIWLDLLPGGRAILAQTADPDPEVVAVSLETGEWTTLFEGATPRYVSSGYLVFWRRGSLWGAPFDPDRLEVLGPPTPFVEGVAIDPDLQAHFAVGGDLLLYQEGPRAAVGRVGQQLVVVDLDGNEEPLPLAPREIGPQGVGWSPDGESIVFESDGQLYTYNVILGTTPRRLTFEGDNFQPVFSPDGSRIVFASTRKGTDDADLFVKDLSNDSPPKPLLTLEAYQLPTQWPTDSLIVFERAEGGVRGRDQTTGDLWTLNLSDPDAPVAKAYLSSEYDLRRMVVSPDLRLAAYASDESGDGRYEIYVRSFPVPGERTAISEGQGFIPYWSPDGNVLYYLVGPELPPIAAHLQRGPMPMVLSRDTLTALSVSERAVEPAPGSSLHPEGDRFIFALRAGSSDTPATDDSTPDRLILEQNFSEALKQLVAIH